MQKINAMGLLPYWKSFALYAALIGVGVTTLYLMHNGWPL
jgi:hypothetical protein